MQVCKDENETLGTATATDQCHALNRFTIVLDSLSTLRKIGSTLLSFFPNDSRRISFPARMRAARSSERDRGRLSGSFI